MKYLSGLTGFVDPIPMTRVKKKCGHFLHLKFHIQILFWVKKKLLCYGCTSVSIWRNWNSEILTVPEPDFMVINPTVNKISFKTSNMPRWINRNQNYQVVFREGNNFFFLNHLPANTINVQMFKFNNHSLKIIIFGLPAPYYKNLSSGRWAFFQSGYIFSDQSRCVRKHLRSHLIRWFFMTC